ncbi:uncharacterized protein [Amphiura filiformis]|uniref:uncharacterized protein isoform X1 n=1 Tax=Amphiura filiformis TaxID=82378 RepID=UPI003B2176DC
MKIGYRCLLSKCLLTMYWVILVICGLSCCGQGAEIGDVRLADGHRPNIGRVEIYLGDRGWFTTCDPTWDIHDAIVVCRQLGFPGAAFARVATYRAIGVPLARSVKCTGYETKLLDCPYHTTQLCTSAVGVVCQEPGYVGCYHDEPHDSMFRAGHDTDRGMDLATCKAFCRTKRAKYVGLKNTQECHCGRNGVHLGQPTHEKFKDSECQMPCSGNSDEICGGVSTKGNYVVSVHHMRSGECSTLSHPSNGYMLDTEYSYGDVVRFQCYQGFSLVGSYAVRCDVNRGLGENRVAWNATAPVCVVSPVTSDNQSWLTRGSSGKYPEYESDNSSLTSPPPTSEASLSITFNFKGDVPLGNGKADAPRDNAKASLTKVLADRPGIVLVIAFVVVLALCVPVFIFVLVRGKFARRKVVADAKSDKNYQDLLYNPSYELDSRYEPLRPPRKSDISRMRKQKEDDQIQQKTKTAPGGLHLDDPYTAWQQQDFGANSGPTHNSMHNLMVSTINAMPQSARRVKSFTQNDDPQMYSNGNTLNFKKHHSSVRNDSVRSFRNGELSRYRQEDDETHYAVVI